MSVYNIVNEKILKALSEGVTPWGIMGCGLRNPASNHFYHGINIQLCALHNYEYGFESPLFLSMRQVNALGGTVNKGANSCMVVYFKMIDKKKEKGQFPLLRYSRVFNIEQTSLDQNMFAAKNGDLNGLFVNYTDGPTIIPGPSEACASYSFKKDVITMPPADSFLSNYGRQGTFYHEIIHSTGHKSRLNRDYSYAKEELIAEIGAAYMLSLEGFKIEPEPHASYLAYYAPLISEDKTLFVSAASHATKAVEYVNERRIIDLNVEVAI